MNRTRLLTAVLVVVILAGITMSAFTPGGVSPASTEVQTDLADGISTDSIDVTLNVHDAGATRSVVSDDGAVYYEDSDVAHAFRSLHDVGPTGWILFAGYSRYDSSDPLENHVRKRVYDAVKRSPGTYPVELAKTTRIPRSTVRYHVRILEEEQLIFGEKLLGRQRYFPRGSDNVGLIAALKDEASRSVLVAIHRLEPASVSHLASDLDRAPSTISYHLSRLTEMELIEQERDNGAVINRLTPQTERDLSRHVDGTSVTDPVVAQSSSTG